ncbi:Uncharacterised protein [Mycobacteroides abscessus subsp. abscessus]|nr:Uncharacterised protein [Mycobacteroides abscessus subsp. abscessus]
MQHSSPERISASSFLLGVYRSADEAARSLIVAGSRKSISASVSRFRIVSASTTPCPSTNPGLSSSPSMVDSLTTTWMIALGDGGIICAGAAAWSGRSSVGSLTASERSSDSAQASHLQVRWLSPCAKAVRASARRCA